MLRRFLLMTLGLGLGLAAGAAADAFHAGLPTDAEFARHTPLPSGLRLAGDFYHDGQPLVMAYMASFAALLALVRWWRQTDPLRSARLSLVSLIVTVIAAGIVGSILQFPEPWLMMVAGCMSVAVQLASPWVPTYARLRPQRKKVI
jgi:heme A synthase